MTRPVFKIILLLLLTANIGVSAFSQAFIAGKPFSGGYHYNVIPDSTLVGPNNHYPPILPAAIYPVDINHDGVNDFALYAAGDWVNGTGDSEISIRIYDTSVCQVAAGYIDTCFSSGSWYFLYPMVKFLRENDTISRNLHWQNSKLYLDYTYWVGMGIANCSENISNCDSSAGYLAVRMIRPGDTIYGWIKVTGINFLTFTVQEFACTMNSTGIGKKSSFSRIFPNPANDFLRIESPGTDGEILVYNLLGEEIMRKKSISQHTSIDFRDMPHGLYLIRLMNGNIVETHTFIKR